MTLTYVLTRDGAYLSQQLSIAYPGETFIVQTGEATVVVQAPDTIPAAAINTIVQEAIVPLFRNYPVRNVDELDAIIDQEILVLTNLKKERLTELAVEIMYILQMLFPTDGISPEGDAARQGALALHGQLAPLYGIVGQLRAEAQIFRAQRGWI